MSDPKEPGAAPPADPLEGLHVLGDPEGGSEDEPGGPGILPVPGATGEWQEARPQDLDGDDESGPQGRRLVPAEGLAVVQRVPISPSILLRAYEYYAAQGRDWWTVGTQDIWHYLEGATFRDQMADLQRQPEQRLYGKEALFIQSLRRMIAADVAEREQQVARSASRGAREAVATVIAALQAAAGDAPVTVDDILTKIKEMDTIG